MHIVLVFVNMLLILLCISIRALEWPDALASNNNNVVLSSGGWRGGGEIIIII